MKTLHLLAAAMLTLAAVATSAASAQGAASAPGTQTPRIDRRQASQEQRIDKGIASNALTAPETARLEKERKRLTKLQNHASRDIARQKHDKQTGGH